MNYYYGIVADEMELFTVNYEETVGDVIQNRNKRFFENTSNPEYLPSTFIDSQVAILDGAIDKINASDLEDFEKAELIDKVKTAKIYPLYRRLICRNSFYSGDIDKQNEVTQEFFDLCDYLGVLYYAEHQSIASLQAKYPYL